LSEIIFTVGSTVPQYHYSIFICTYDAIRVNLDSLDQQRHISAPPIPVFNSGRPCTHGDNSQRNGSERSRITNVSVNNQPCPAVTFREQGEVFSNAGALLFSGIDKQNSIIARFSQRLANLVVAAIRIDSGQDTAERTLQAKPPPISRKNTDAGV
jgi:hypothetical protein